MGVSVGPTEEIVYLGYITNEDPNYKLFYWSYGILFSEDPNRQISSLVSFISSNLFPTVVCVLIYIYFFLLVVVYRCPPCPLNLQFLIKYFVDLNTNGDDGR